MKMPIPPLIACCRLSGIDLMIIFLILVTVIRTLTIPQMNTMAKACCQVKPSEKTTVKVKKAFKPIPGAKA
jgi:hypothetical protein